MSGLSLNSYLMLSFIQNIHGILKIRPYFGQNEKREKMPRWKRIAKIMDNDTSFK